MCTALQDQEFKSNPAVITVCVSFLIHMSLLGSAEGFACQPAAFAMMRRLNS